MPIPRPVHKPVDVTVEAVAHGSIDEGADDTVVDDHQPSWLLCLFLQLLAPRVNPLGIRCVFISDTHGMHRQLTLPEGDVLIHAGDFTRMGDMDDCADFNLWLGEQPHAHKIVVFGNHEHNAEWKADADRLLCNATLLRDASVTLEVRGGRQLRVHGTNFCWPMRSRNPVYDEIAEGTVDVLVAHGPVAGYADGGKGCAELLRVAQRVRPRLVVGGAHPFRTRGGTGPRAGPRVNDVCERQQRTQAAHAHGLAGRSCGHLVRAVESQSYMFLTFFDNASRGHR